MTLGEFRELTKDMPESASLEFFQAAYCSGYKKVGEYNNLQQVTPITLSVTLIEPDFLLLFISPLVSPTHSGYRDKCVDCALSNCPALGSNFCLARPALDLWYQVLFGVKSPSFITDFSPKTSIFDNLAIAGTCKIVANRKHSPCHLAVLPLQLQLSDGDFSQIPTALTPVGWYQEAHLLLASSVPVLNLIKK